MAVERIARAVTQGCADSAFGGPLGIAVGQASLSLHVAVTR
jgi:hypothetical protein